LPLLAASWSARRGRLEAVDDGVVRLDVRVQQYEPGEPAGRSFCAAGGIRLTPARRGTRLQAARQRPCSRVGRPLCVFTRQCGGVT